MRVVLLEEGEHITADAFTARPRDMLPRLYRDAAQHATLGRPPILLPLGRAVGGTTLVNSGTCFRTPDAVLERWQREFGLDGLTPDALAPHFERVERELNVQPRAARARGRQRARRAPRRRAARLVGRLHPPQRARLRRLGRVRLRLPRERQAARRRHLRPEGARRRRDDLHAACARAGSSAAGAARPASRRRPAAADGCASTRHRRRRRGRDPHPRAARPQRARRRVGPARAQPLPAPRHRRVGGDGRGRRHGARRPAVLLRRRVRLRRDHARGHRGPARLRRDGAARGGRAPPRADGRLPLDGPVRPHGLRRLARARALARRAPRRALRPLRRRHGAREARPRAPGRAVLGRGRALGAAPARAPAGAARRRLRRRCATSTSAPRTSS